MAQLMTGTKRKSYYKQLKPHVMGFVEHYIEDFTVHDRAYFRKHPDGRFLYAMRVTGTDICNLDGWDDMDDELKVVSGHLWGNPMKTEKQDQKEFAKTWMTTFNKRWFHGYDGCIQEISKEAALGIIDAL